MSDASLITRLFSSGFTSVPFATEAELVRAFGTEVARSGVTLPDGSRLRAFVVGHEIDLPGASRSGNTGSADLLMVTEDWRWWLVEAKLARSSECTPHFVFGNQLARYAASIEAIGIAQLHDRLESYLFGRRMVLKPPTSLAPKLLAASTLASAVDVWLATEGITGLTGTALTASLHSQIANRTLTIAALTDQPAAGHREWIGEQAGARSAAAITMDNESARVWAASLLPVGAAVGSVTLPPFSALPQTYLPSPSTLPIMLRESAFSLFAECIAPQIERWIGAPFNEALPLDVTSAAFSLHLASDNSRTVCLQFGRTDFRIDDPGPGAYPLKFLVNLIWAGEYAWCLDGSVQTSGERQELITLVQRLALRHHMRVKGIPAKVLPGSSSWTQLLDSKVFGSENGRTELVLAYSRAGREDLGWEAASLEREREHLSDILCAIERYLGSPPYRAIPRPKTTRKVPGTLRPKHSQ